jgi:DnaJ-domain-containing protein 1
MGRVAWLKRTKKGFEAGFQLLDVRPHVAARLRQIAEFGFIPESTSYESDPPNSHPRRAEKAHSTNPYAILQIEATASDEQVQKAYRKMARLYHPDVNKSPDAVAKFEQIVGAYRALQKRRIGFGT